MDIYQISFLISTLWVGPFWIAMLVNPEKEKTKNLLREPLFFAGPIIFLFILNLLNPQGLMDIFKSQSESAGFLESLGSLLATKAGVSATWAHMVVGDIFVTRWIWSKSLEIKCNLWVTRLSIFFGVILMPLGLAIFTIANFLKRSVKD